MEEVHVLEDQESKLILILSCLPLQSLRLRPLSKVFLMHFLTVQLRHLLRLSRATSKMCQLDLSVHLHLEVELQATYQQFLLPAHVQVAQEFKPIKALSRPDRREWVELVCKVTLTLSRGSATQWLPPRTVRPLLPTTWKLFPLEPSKPLSMEPKQSVAILMLLAVLPVRERVGQEFRHTWTRFPRHQVFREGQELVVIRTV